jgi:hypothetical protein
MKRFVIREKICATCSVLILRFAILQCGVRCFVGFVANSCSLVVSVGMSSNGVMFVFWVLMTLLLCGYQKFCFGR